jgi:tripartite-type tricarboxylate transporter receptor subunit TctC
MESEGGDSIRVGQRDFTRKLSRRLSAVVLASVAVCTLGSSVQAQDYPVRPVKIIVPFPAGGTADAMPRLIADWLSRKWGQAVVIENRTGAGGTIGTNIVAKANPDGYTLLTSSSAFAISAALKTDLPYDPLKDFAGVTRIGFSKGILVVTPSLGVKTLKEFIEYARARPGKILFSSAGAGSSTHINGERFRLAAGFRPVHVAFKGSADAMLEVVAGRCHYIMAGFLTTLPYIKDGRLVPLAIVTPTRSPLMPELPTIAEVLPGYKRDGSHVMLAPAATPRPVLNRISEEVRRIFDLPDVKDRTKNFDYLLMPTTPEEMDRILRADIETFSEVVRLAGLRPK